MITMEKLIPQHGRPAPSPLEGEGRGGGWNPASARRQWASWHPPTQDACARRRRTPRPNCGLDCATNRSTAFDSAGSTRSGHTSLIFSVLQHVSLWKSMAGSMIRRGQANTNGRDGLKIGVIVSSDSGTTRSSVTSRGYSASSRARSPILDPHPDPPPQGGRA